MTQPLFGILDEDFAFGDPAPKRRQYSADRTRSPKWRAGSRRNKRIKNVPTFFTDWWRR